MTLLPYHTNINHDKLINNPNYCNQAELKLENIFWHRIILDECHEVLVPNATRKADVQMMTFLNTVQSRYRWCCTGDPLAKNFDSFKGVVSFLTDTEIKLTNKLMVNFTRDD